MSLEAGLAYAAIVLIVGAIIVAALRERARRRRQIISQSEFNERLRKKMDDPDP
jgi:hypothetical protein